MVRVCRDGGALLETIIAMVIVAIFLSGLHLTNSQVMSQVRGSLESGAALRLLSGRREQVRASTWTQMTDVNFLQTTLLAEEPDSCAELGSVVETIELNAPLVPPVTLSRLPSGTVQVVNAGDGTMKDQLSVRVELTASWTGKGGHAHTRQVSLIVAQGGLLGRN